MPSLPWYVDCSAMWKTSFVATAVAMGDDVDGALAVVVPGPETHALVTGLRAPQRAARAQTLAEALHVVALAVDEVTLR